MPRHILLIDDDALMRRSLSFNLEQNGFRATTAASAEDGLLSAQADSPDLVILDIGLPGMDGLQALREFRDRLGLPVILLTARRRELDEVLGLELGADDYITKPYNLDVLLAHVKAVLRRSALPEPSAGAQPIVIGDLEIDPAAHSVMRAGQLLALTPREFDLLIVLAQNAGRVVAAEDLLKAVWGAEYVGEPQVVYVHMRGLREKIEEDPKNPRRILTMRGVGYRLNPLPTDTPTLS
jgi:DNA-binding response OmpR family regulator